MAQTNYVIDVYTGAPRHAGTDSTISVILIGIAPDGSDVRTGEIKLDKRGDNFGRNQLDTFEIDAPDLGELDQIYVKNACNVGAHSGWFLDKIVVTVRSGRDRGRIYTFSCNDWLSKNTKQDRFLDCESKYNKISDSIRLGHVEFEVITDEIAEKMGLM
jgi:hypothetical protein